MHARLRRWRIALTTVRSNLALFSLAGALVVAIAGSTAGLLWHLRVLELDEATREIANLNLVIAEQAARSIKNIALIANPVEQ